MSRSKAIIGILLIFAFGVAVGLALSIRLSVNRIRDIAASTPQQLAAITTYRINQKVRFTPEQHTEALRILTEAEQAIAAEQAKAAPAVAEITLRAHREIALLLSPAQLKQLPSLTPLSTPEPNAAE